MVINFLLHKHSHFLMLNYPSSPHVKVMLAYKLYKLITPYSLDSDVIKIQFRRL